MLNISTLPEISLENYSGQIYFIPIGLHTCIHRHIPLEDLIIGLFCYSHGY
jgi:hypothetical protein